MASVWRSSILVILVALLALPVFACVQSKGKMQTGGQAQVAATRGGSGGRYDQQIQKEVTEELEKHKELKGVKATTEDGIVTLEGSVATYLNKLEARNKIHNKPHVEGVRNHIAVKGATVPDSELREKLADELRYDRIDRGIIFNNFNLNVKGGVVTISGQARTPSDKASALAIVEDTPGVKDVIDDIEVLPTSIFDDETRIRVARAIYGDPALQKYALDPQAPIRIVVENGHVTLYGVVENQMDRQIAEMRAKGVPNVFSVTDKLAVANQTAK